MTGGALRLFASGRLVGRLSSGGEGPRLAYGPEWRTLTGAFPVSSTLPLAEPEHLGPAVETWLQGLLPFGALRLRVAATLGLDPSDTLSLLARLGGDAPGAIRFVSERHNAPDAAYRPIEDLDALGARWRETPLLLDDPSVGHTLCAEQDDCLPVALLSLEQKREGGQGDQFAPPRLALALNGAPSTHFLWRAPLEAPELIEGRAFHMALAARIGVRAAQTRVLAAKRERYLLIARDDREQRGQGWVRQHRETLAQAVGAPPEERYGREAGARTALEQIFLWADRALPARERLRLLDAFMFNALTGATDAHALSYAIRLQPEVAVAALMTAPGPGPAGGAERRFAQRVGGPARWPDRILPEHWRGFAISARLNPTFTLDRLTTIAGAIAEAASPVAATLRADEPLLRGAIVDRFAREAYERAKSAAERLRDRRP